MNTKIKKFPTHALYFFLGCKGSCGKSVFDSSLGDTPNCDFQQSCQCQVQLLVFFICIICDLRSQLLSHMIPVWWLLILSEPAWTRGGIWILWEVAPNSKCLIWAFSVWEYSLKECPSSTDPSSPQGDSSFLGKQLSLFGEDGPTGTHGKRGMRKWQSGALSEAQEKTVRHLVFPWGKSLRTRTESHWVIKNLSRRKAKICQLPNRKDRHYFLNLISPWSYYR